MIDYPGFYRTIANILQIVDLGEKIGGHFEGLNKICNKKTCEGCCNSCAYSGGYLWNLRYDFPEIVEYLKKEYKFNERHGFLGENGCTLPRHFRSGTCLGFVCWDYKEEFYSESLKILLKNLRLIRIKELYGKEALVLLAY